MTNARRPVSGVDELRRFEVQREERSEQLLGPRPAADDLSWTVAQHHVDRYRLEFRVREAWTFGEPPRHREQWDAVDQAVQRHRERSADQPAVREPTDDEIGWAVSPDGPVVLYRGQLVDVRWDGDSGAVLAAIQSDWRPPFAPDVEDWVRVHDVPVAPRATDVAASLVGHEVRVALERVDDPVDGVSYRVAAAEPAPPLPHVTPDELGWTLSTIVDCPRHGHRSSQLGVASVDEVAAEVGRWSDPDGFSQVSSRVRAAMDVAREVGYAVTAYSHELDPTIAPADTERLIVLTDTGRQACVAWESIYAARTETLLGPAPEKASKARAWDIASRQIDSYRLRYRIEDPRGLGEPSGERWQDRDRAYVERTIGRVGRIIEPPSLGPDLGLSR